MSCQQYWEVFEATLKVVFLLFAGGWIGYFARWLQDKYQGPG